MTNPQEKERKTLLYVETSPHKLKEIYRGEFDVACELLNDNPDLLLGFEGCDNIF